MFYTRCICDVIDIVTDSEVSYYKDYPLEV
jgi:hypothetical protein